MSISLSAIEIILLTLQVLLIPIAKNYINESKREIIQSCKDLILKNSTNLNTLKQNLVLLETNINHQQEIEKLNLEILRDRLSDLEIYLEKTNGFRRRHQNKIE